MHAKIHASSSDSTHIIRQRSTTCSLDVNRRSRRALEGKAIYQTLACHERVVSFLAASFRPSTPLHPQKHGTRQLGLCPSSSPVAAVLGAIRTIAPPPPRGTPVPVPSFQRRTKKKKHDFQKTTCGQNKDVQKKKRRMLPHSWVRKLPNSPQHESMHQARRRGGDVTDTNAVFLSQKWQHRRCDRPQAVRRFRSLLRNVPRKSTQRQHFYPPSYCCPSDNQSHPSGK